jgi:hypothetical protein
MAWLAWKERLVAERLQRKSGILLGYLKEANNHWEEVFWWILARSFGSKVNGTVFESVSRSLPISLLARHKNQIHQLEALLFGQAGLLNVEFLEDYPQMLQREYRFLQKKYGLQPVKAVPFFLRMRPANFPTLRLAQLAMIIHMATHLFAKLREAESLAQVRALFDITPNDYWHYHYRFDEPGEYKVKVLGKQMVDTIVINTVVPVIFSYGLHTNQQEYKDKALAWLAELPPEQNHIVSKWTEFGVSNSNALESQALIELKNNYCDQKRCLECAVGNTILQAKTV